MSWYTLLLGLITCLSPPLGFSNIMSLVKIYFALSRENLEYQLYTHLLLLRYYYYHRIIVVIILLLLLLLSLIINIVHNNLTIQYHIVIITTIWYCIVRLLRNFGALLSRLYLLRYKKRGGERKLLLFYSFLKKGILCSHFQFTTRYCNEKNICIYAGINTLNQRMKKKKSEVD